MSTPNPGQATTPPRDVAQRIHLALRVAAMGLGLPSLVLALAAWLARWVDRPWVALGLATVVAVLPTLLLVDRLLPADDPRKGRGIPTDVLSLVWLGGAFLAFGPLAPWLNAPLHALGDEAHAPSFVHALIDFTTGSVDDAAPHGATAASDASDADDATEAAPTRDAGTAEGAR